MATRVERQIELLEGELLDENLTEADRKLIQQEIKDLTREIADEMRWRDQGEERGWQQ